VSSGLIPFKNLGFFKVQAGEISNIKPAENPLELSPTFLKSNKLNSKQCMISKTYIFAQENNLVDETDQPAAAATKINQSNDRVEQYFESQKSLGLMEQPFMHQ
jgi:hypothetical protein